ncbi:hypothetical protein [Anaeromyxobacter diazotrophicus]|uniref:Uncharacterized protein n=1 Tax=Anaeromyxobacter diazotrophicus TaxID=2590199 RepID=A0A7I9VJ32_9BACT|nr:hypothetical protein [Anaeromyxobacter diazotrophicus]GEJ56158.1 hypothetical protein AMYX_08990 [Anaeromyxobacter diazotrophicus]
MAGAERREPPGAADATRRGEERVTGAQGGLVTSRREPDDPREEEGWTQPESSAQKGALPDEG